MKVSQEEKSLTHEKIIKGASKLFRSKGISATSVADVMAAAGLTHGGFYRHFKDKDELLEVAIKASFDEVTGLLTKNNSKTKSANSLKEYEKRYLSKAHINNPGMGCPISALGQEISREGPKLKEVFSTCIEELICELKAGFLGSDLEKNNQAIRELSMLVGAVVIARASNSKTAQKIISACEEVL